MADPIEDFEDFETLSTEAQEDCAAHIQAEMELLQKYMEDRKRTVPEWVVSSAVATMGEMLMADIQ